MLAGLSKSDVANDPAVMSENDEQRRMVREALSQLDANQRQVLELSYFDGLSHSEIARQTAKPLGTVKTNIRNAIAKLRDALRVREKSASRSGT
jgi:RNA polymerase sigma-70 factor (ECF subfamily)